ncbi:hypothetical protein BC941DRAFT_411220 [Chlamydoabsidia padenii]|nr:hypothetical protein BC941DRAFT_411220 [Chlamydoabsidia padenii]
MQNRFYTHTLKHFNSLPFLQNVRKLTKTTPTCNRRSLRQQHYMTTSDYAKMTTDSTISAQYIRPSANLATAFSLNELYRDFILLPEFITPEEHDMIVHNCEKKLKRSLGRNAPYEQGHFDGVITNYKECSVSSWTVGAEWMDQFIQQRIYGALFPSSYQWLSPHILDLCRTGEIRGHVDNLEASGSVVAGLCLKSPAKMILEHQDDPTCQVEIFLPARCFYIQRDSVRYQFKHAIAGPDNSIWDGKKFDKHDRISLMFRNQKDHGKSPVL